MIIFVLLLLSGCAFPKLQLWFNRTDNATKRPAPTNEITDVRITLVPRECDMFVEKEGEIKREVQLYYGYELDGKWYDYPAVNYPLFSLTDRPEIGFSVISGSHGVKIGPYLLLSVELSSSAEASDYWWDISDSMGSEFTRMFAEYAEDPDITYGMVAEEIDWERPNWIGSDFYVSSSMHVWDVLILEYDALPDDYVLCIKNNYGATVEISAEDIRGRVKIAESRANSN